MPWSASVVLAAVCCALVACGPSARSATEPPAGPPSPEPSSTGGSPAPGTPAPAAGLPSTASTTPASTAAPAVRPTPLTDTRSCADPPCRAQPVRAGQFDAARIPGASGLAVSRRNPGVLYVLDDRPGTAEVWAVRPDGELVGAVAIAGLDGVDTEALAVGPCEPGSVETCLYVGDIGDNGRGREGIAVHRVPEPDLSEGVPAEPLAAAVARLRHPGGPEDAEALIVDAGGVPHIITKARFDPETRTTGEARLLRAPGFTDGEMEDLGVLPVPEPAEPMHSLFVGNVVTGADHVPGRVVVRTYDQVLEYVADAADAPLAGLPGWRVRSVPAPFDVQSEAIAYDVDGCGYRSVGEGAGDIWHVACR